MSTPRLKLAMFFSALFVTAGVAVGGCGGESEAQTPPPAPGQTEPTPPPPPPSVPPGPTPPPPTNAEWTPISPGGKTLCARGDPFTFWTRVGDPRKLVIFFQGGGACFDGVTCALGSRFFEDTAGPEDNPEFDRGIFELENPANPFRDWSWVVIPTCTGDVYIGDRTTNYGTVTVQHRGWQNARAALSYAFENFPEPSQVFVSGCSAGAVGSPFHVPAVIGRWPKARVTQLGDGFAFVFPEAVSLEPWGAPARFPSFFKIGSSPFTMVQYMRALTKRYPKRTFARVNHMSDNVQKMFLRAAGGDRKTFEPLLQIQETLLKKIPNYRSYVACGSYHCALPTPRFYSTKVDGVVLSDWVRDLVNARNVTCPDCFK